MRIRSLANCEANKVLAGIIAAVLDEANKASLMNLQKTSINEDFYSR